MEQNHTQLWFVFAKTGTATFGAGFYPVALQIVAVMPILFYAGNTQCKVKAFKKDIHFARTYYQHAVVH
jgi:hypothetical protein